MRVGAAYTQTGVLAKGRTKGSAGEIEELGRKQGLAGASPPPKSGTRREAGTATQVPSRLLTFVLGDPTLEIRISARFDFLGIFFFFKTLNKHKGQKYLYANFT